MSDTPSRDYVESARTIMSGWYIHHPPNTTIAGEARAIAKSLLEYIDALEGRHRGEVERIKADRDALRDELDGHKATLALLDADCEHYKAGCERYKALLADRRTGPCSLQEVPRTYLSEEYFRDRLVELTKAVDELRHRLDSRGNNH